MPRSINPRQPKITPRKEPIHPSIFYTYEEITHIDSPYRSATPSTFFKAIREGKLPVYRNSGKPLVRGADLIEWLTGRPVDGQADSAAA